MARPLRLAAFIVSVSERHRIEMHREDCLTIIAMPNLKEDKRNIITQPYLQRNVKPKAQEPRRSRAETVDFIFEGVRGKAVEK